jgi:alpha-beta hydrolase superfamily lysophospholipase
MVKAQPLVRGRAGARAARAGRGLAALTLAVALSACAVGGPVPFAQPSGYALSGPALAGHDGAPLALSVWRPEGPPRAAILAVHGFGDYAPSTFAEAAAAWAAEGVEVWAYDQRGFGRNASRGAWPGVDALIDDFAAAAAQVRAARPDLPLTAVGHSMGGGVVLAALGEGRAPQVDAAVLAAPAIAGGDRIGPLSRAGAWALTAVLPDRRWTGEGLVQFQASDDIDLLRRMASDPLYIGDPSAREILGLIRLMDRAAAAAPAASAPILVLHGAKDELIEEADVRAVAGRAPELTGVVVYPEGWHLLFGDLQKRAVWADVAAFALAQGGGS